MSNPSSGTAGLTSDGERHPQQWETTFTYQTNESLKTMIDETDRLTRSYGQDGWEIVNSTIQRTQVVHRFK
jgi:sirohydrochlorin ferrochelatase